jgi:tRNA pseudouridine13 synthase
VSIPRITEEAMMTTKVDGIEVLWADRHINKIRLGHLVGNRFAIKIRDVEPTDVIKLRPMLDVLQKRGMPNFFGEQRFGMRLNNHVLGACLIRGRPEELLHHLLGGPNADLDDGDVFDARRKFDEGNFEQSLDRWPRKCGLERRTLSRLMKTKKPGEAARSIDEKIRRLWVSALQSHLFNEVLTARIETVDKIIPGDFAIKHENGACFQVTDPAAEQPRADGWEISATGPIVGHRMSFPEGDALEIEQKVLKANGLTPGHFKQEGRDQAKGTRRPLRVQPKDIDLAAGVDDHGAHITVAFTLPSGCFATVLLGELMKNEQNAASAAIEQPADAPADAEVE